MAVTDPAAGDWVYDEWAYLHENAADVGVDPATMLPVRRVETRLADGRIVSGLRWGDTDPELVVVHGSAQNAHTWDSTLVRLGRPALAVDLPGHGHSSWRDDRTYHPGGLADDLAAFVDEHAATAGLVCGMSLGGMTVLQLARRRPDLVHRFVLVDITPGGDPRQGEGDPRLHRRSSVVPGVLRHLRPHGGAQPDPHEGVAATGDRAQRSQAPRRLVGVAL